MNCKNTPVPEPIAQLQKQLEQFRSSRPARTRLPGSLWQAAEELARRYGVYPVAHAPRLDYTRLKKRLGGALSPRRKSPKASFVELVAQPPASLDGCTTLLIFGITCRTLGRAHGR
jgi:hypothetical protein